MMIDVIQKGIEYGRDLKVDFVDVRYQNKYIASYRSQDGELTVNSGSRRGFSTRVLSKGAFGFASTTSIELKDLKSIIQQAAKLATYAAAVVVAKVGTETVTIKELKEKLENE